MSHQDRDERHTQDGSHDEETPLLQSGTEADRESVNSRVDQGREEDEDLQRSLSFPPSDPEHPRSWPARKKLINVTIIALMAILSPLASSMFTPGITQIAEDFGTSEQNVIATTTAFVITLGLGPLLWAPLSEDFGRRRLYTWCFTVFTALQIVCAVSPTVEVLIAIRGLSGFFGSEFGSPYLSGRSTREFCGILMLMGTSMIRCWARKWRRHHQRYVSIVTVCLHPLNSDQDSVRRYEPSERAGVFGWYLLGPLLGKSQCTIQRSFQRTSLRYLTPTNTRSHTRTALWRCHCH